MVRWRKNKWLPRQQQSIDTVPVGAPDGAVGEYGPSQRQPRRYKPQSAYSCAYGGLRIIFLRKVDEKKM